MDVDDVVGEVGGGVVGAGGGGLVVGGLGGVAEVGPPVRFFLCVTDGAGRVRVGCVGGCDCREIVGTGELGSVGAGIEVVGAPFGLEFEASEPPDVHAASAAVTTATAAASAARDLNCRYADRLSTAGFAGATWGRRAVRATSSSRPYYRSGCRKCRPVGRRSTR